jgi:hypothetical protein
MAASASTPATSEANRRFSFPRVPKVVEADRSIASSTVSSRSSTKRFTYGFRIRAVTFQSMDWKGSPGSYARTSENSMP